MTWDQLLPMLWEGTVETLYMTLWSSAIAYLIGLPLGVLLVVTRRGGIMPSVTFNAILGVAINFLRSIPFVIMIAVLFPVEMILDMLTKTKTNDELLTLLEISMQKSGK